MDDALIYQRYVQNLLEGHGLVYNLGERFNGLTSPLYVALLAAFAWLLQQVQWAAILVSSLFTGLALWLFQRLFGSVEANPLLAVAGAVLAACSPYLYYVYGMETGLFLFLIALCLYLFEKQQIFWLGIACALLILTRSEGVFLVLALAIEHFRQRRPFPEWRYFIIPALLFILFYGFNWLYFGHFLAETGSAKIDQGRSGLWGEWPIFIRESGYLLDWYISGKLWLLLLWLTAIGAGILRLGWHSLNIISLSFLLLYGAFFVLLNIPNYHWYYAPYFMFGFFYAGLGLAWLLRVLYQRARWLGLGAGLAALALFGAVNVYQTAHRADFGRHNAAYQLIGSWLEQNSPPESKIAMAEIGHVGYYSRRYIIDMLGLVNPLNSSFVGERRFSEWLRHYDPDYILIHQPLWPHEQGALAAALLGDWDDPAPREIPGFGLMRKRSMQREFFPTQLHSQTAVNVVKQDREYALLVHAPSLIRFDLPAGRYRLSAEYGLVATAYQGEKPRSDGADFYLLLDREDAERQFLFHRLLNPQQNPEDRGKQFLHDLTFTLPQAGQLLLHTQVGPHQHNLKDWTYWRNVRLSALPED